jgi:hypothetical protein
LISFFFRWLGRLGPNECGVLSDSCRTLVRASGQVLYI